MKAEDFTFITRKGLEDDGVRFVVEYPEFPGITGGGDTISEAIKEAQEALEMFIEYRKKEKKEIVDKKYERITLRLPSVLHSLCKEYSKKLNISLNKFLTDAASNYIEEYKNYNKIDL